jgi:hypothetical protein
MAWKMFDEDKPSVLRRIWRVIVAVFDFIITTAEVISVF